MKKTLVALIPGSILGMTLMVGRGTYALFSASASNGSQFAAFGAEVVRVNSSTDGSSTGLRSNALMANQTQQIRFPMFYDHADYPTGPNPYDYKTTSQPSGEIPGGWEPGDQVTRAMTVQNQGAASKLTEVTASLGSLQDQMGNTIPSTSPAYQDFLNHMQMKVYSPEDGYAVPVYTGSFGQLVSGAQPLDRMIYLARGNSSTQVRFVASMDLGAGNDLQGIKGMLDFTLQAEQTGNNCFDPPFSNRDYSMKIGSTTPIKFETFDVNGGFSTNSNQNVRLVITGPLLGGGTLTISYTLSNGLSCNGGHYQANVYGDPSLFVQGDTYTATVYNGSQICCQKSFSTDPGNRSNAP